MQKHIVIFIMVTILQLPLLAMKFSAYPSNVTGALLGNSSDSSSIKPQKKDSGVESNLFYTLLAVAKAPVKIKIKNPKDKAETIHLVFPVLVQQRETNQFIIKLIVVNKEQEKLIYKTEYLKALNSLVRYIKKGAHSPSWEDSLQFTKKLLHRSNHIIWACLLIDSLYELFRAQGFTKLILAFELNEEGRLNEWLRDYLRNFKENINGNICAANTTALISAVAQIDDEGDKADDPLCLLVEIGKVDLNKTNDDKSTALMFAASLNHVKALEFLLKKGAAIDLIDLQGRTALHLATAAHHSQAVACLLNYRANTEISSSDSMFTPLLTAIFGMDAVIVELLLKAGANPNVMADSNNTALMLAITLLNSIRESPELYQKVDENNALQIVLHLLADNRTNFQFICANDDTALKTAELYNLQDIVSAIKSREKTAL